MSDKKKLEAQEILRAARAARCAVELRGSWVEFNPPLSFDLLMRATKVGNEMAEILKEEAKNGL